jgi:capsular polysaccharide biosynthesis protein/Mrp family chromosome partitioning ATPase
MELRLILTALRRSRLIILVTIIACTVPAIALRLTRSSTYEAKNVLYIQPPGSQGNGNVNYNDPDRYVVSQIGVLQSSSLADSVAKRLKVKDSKAIERSVTFSHTPKTDLITIVAHHSNADTAKTIANTYADLYIAEQVASVKKSQEPAFAALEKRLETISTGLEDADKKLTANPTDSLALVSRDALLSEYGEVVRAKTNLQFLSRVDARSSVLDAATTAQEVTGTSLPVQLLAGLLVGSALGAAIALAIMVFSSTVSDAGQIEEAFGDAPIGPIKSVNNFPRDQTTVLSRNAWPFGVVAKNVAIRSEALAPQSSSTLVVAVTSPFVKTGVTSLSSAVAGYFARSGAQVVLVDASEIAPTITREFDALDGEKFARHIDEALSRQSPIDPNWLQRALVPTETENVRVLGGLAKFLNRGNLPAITKAVRKSGNVAIIDCPSTETSPTSVRLAPNVDVIVYVVPINRLRMHDLKSGLAQFGETPVIIALTNIGARQFFFG